MQATYDQFTALLPEAECRYAVYDFAYIGKARSPRRSAAAVALLPCRPLRALP